MMKQRYWMAGAAVVAAVAAFPLTQAGQAAAQPTKAGVQTTVVQPTSQSYDLRLISSGWLAWATNGSLSRG
jgi:hypothetical protein